MKPLCTRCGRGPQSPTGFCKPCNKERKAIDAWRADNQRKGRQANGQRQDTRTA